jgi:hypothetical protein
VSLRRPTPVTAATLVAALLGTAAVCGCKSGPMADGKRPSASKGDEPRGSLPPPSERSERLFRVDTLVMQWDSAQADGRDEETATLAEKIGQEVDADFATFRDAARGGIDLRSQSLAVKALAFSKNPEALDILVARLAESDPDLVANALIGIKLRSDPSTPIPPLVTLLRSKAPAIRRFAPLAFANVLIARETARLPLDPQLAPRAMGGLVGLLEDRDPVVRLHVAKAMGALRAAEASDFLVLMLKDEHPRIRIAAAAALERVGDPRAFPKIVELLDEIDEEQKPLVREILVSYAGRIQGAPLSPEQRAQFDVSPRAWDRWFASRTPSPVQKSGVLSPGSRPPAASPPPTTSPAPSPAPDVNPPAAPPQPGAQPTYTPPAKPEPGAPLPQPSGPRAR